MRLTGCQSEPHRKPVGTDDRMYLTGPRDSPMNCLLFRVMQAPY
jgi:hypothetical protein